MVPPLSLGTLLRQRYLIQDILGQGGFGRTYLAIDQERFDEQCVIKEFSVPYDDEILIKKSQTLFHREASTLYQIQHPQVPRFWAAFEEAQRLFLVQDFIPGKTYRLLLQERQQQGDLFTEVDILFLLRKTLPVLTYLHDRGIIHRDLSPENIILNPTPQATESGAVVGGLPVIIDFGAVKEATTHWYQTSAITRVGKVGYAPPEQLQTGKVYPNSDLYSLAATCLVLLTGQEPRSLVDAETLAWNWQTHALISPELGAILRRMLSVYPSDRFDSAAAVEQELQTLLGQIPTAAQIATAPFPTPTPAIALPSLPARSRPAPTHPIPETHLDDRPYLHPQTHPWLRLSMVTAFVLGSAIAGNWLWQRWQASPAGGEVWVSGTKVPRAEASRIIGAPGLLSGNTLQPSFDPNQSTPTPTSPLKERPVSTTASPPQEIDFPPNQISTTVEGTVLENATQSYLLNAAKGQILTATLNGSGVVMSVLRANQEGIDSAAYQTRSWTGNLPADGQYLIQVSGAGQYLLDVALTPTSRPNQDRTDRVSFARGTNGTTVTGTIAPQQLRRYLLKAQQGQLVLIKVIEGTVSFSAIAPNGERLGGTTATAKEWKGQLPIAGDYVIEVTAAQPGDYALSFEIF